MHATPGQGARTAFEDAHQLNLLLDEVFNGPNKDITMEKALKRCLWNPLDYLLRMNLLISQLL
jgi:2-polyprenyl-6-methoxyphenol hydroxylase-like FAD-dependent oxidoreductase